MVSVVMAAYNGEKWIGEQLNSIFGQTTQDFVLYVNDDCSTDDTYIILEEYQKRYPGRIVLSRSSRNSGSAKYNFLDLIFSTDAEYTFLSDQDDVWEADKVEKSLAKMADLEGKYGKDVPILVHTDLRVVDSELNVIAPSYREQVVHPEWGTFGLAQALMMNIATGSTICYNRALREKLKKPEYVVMHDWWLLQTALLFGHVGHIYEQTVKYRQHIGNELGSSNVKSVKYKLRRLIHNDKVTKRFRDSYLQAEALLKAYRGEMTEAQILSVETYANLAKFGKIRRVYTAFKIGALNTTLSRKIGAIMFM